MALINSTFYPTNKTKNGTVKTGSTGFSTNTVTNIFTTYAVAADRLSNVRNIWGQPFDGSADISGSFLLNNGNANMQVYAPFKAGSYYAPEVSFIFFEPTMNAVNKSKFYFKRTDVDFEDSNLHIYSADNNNFLDLDTTGIMHRLVNQTVKLSATSLTWNGNSTIHSDGQLTIEAQLINMDFGAGTIKANTGRFNNIYDAGAGDIFFGSPVHMNKNLLIDGTINANTINSVNINNSDTIKTKDLTVYGNAHFFNLEIDNITQAGGNVILSAASFVIDDFDTGRTVSTSINYGVAGNGKIDNNYKTIYLYQIAVDENGQKIKNEWKAGDHAICYTANVDDESAVDMRSWWTLVFSTGTEINRTINGKQVLCNMIEIVEQVNTTDNATYINPSWGTVHVEIGDNVCLLGSYLSDRRSAIVLSAMQSFDPVLQAPCIIQYENIDGFTLLNKAKTYFSKGANRIVGSLIVESSGQSIEQMISQNEQYLHIAYADDTQGTNFIRASELEDSDTTVYAYIGLVNDSNSDDSSYTYDRYTWTRINSDTADGIKMNVCLSNLFVDSNDNLKLYFGFKVPLSYEQIHTRNYKIFVALRTQRYPGSEFRELEFNLDDIHGVSVNNVSDCAIYQTLQEDWSEQDLSERYDYAVVTLYRYVDQSDFDVLDYYSMVLQYEATAVLSINEDIKTRVSDAEGNISTLVQTASSITSTVSSLDASVSQIRQTADQLSVRIQNAEDQLSILVDPDSVTVDIADLKGDVNNLQISLAGLQQNTTAINSSINTIQTVQNNFQVGINGLSNRLTAVEEEASNIDGALSTVREQQSLIEQRIDNINLSVSDKIVGGQNILNSADFGRISDSQVKEDWYSQTGWYQNHPTGQRKSTLVAPDIYSPVADGTVGRFEVYTDPTNVQDGVDPFHLDPSGNYLVELLRQDITGKLKPATWYTLSFYTLLYDEKSLISYIFPNVGNPNYHYYINGVESSYTPSDVNVDWRNSTASALPTLNGGYKRVSVTFKTRDDLSSTANVYVLFRGVAVNNNGSHAYPVYAIAQPKLEEGQYATQFSYSQRDIESYINLTAGEINLKVRDGLQESGIDITNKKITLSSETTEISGNINFYSNSGITVYDSSANPRIQLQPVSIGPMDDYTSDANSIYTISGNTTANSAQQFSSTTTAFYIDALEANQNFKFVGISCFGKHGNNDTWADCTAPTALIRIRLQKNGVNAFDQTVNASKSLFFNQYNNDDVLSFNASEAGTYILYITLSTIDNVRASEIMNVFAWVKIERYTDHQTIIATDGFCAYSGAEKNIWISSEGIRLQNQTNGIMWRGSGYGNTNMKVAVNTTTNRLGEDKTLWLPFYNYSPMFSPAWSTSPQYIPHMQLSRYVYRIDPVNDVGDCYIFTPPKDSNNNKQDGFVILPDIEWTSGDFTYRLPAGYRVRIINNTRGDNAVAIYVTTWNDIYNSKWVITDDNNNLNTYSELTSSGGKSDTFIWTLDGWRQLKDTQ